MEPPVPLSLGYFIRILYRNDCLKPLPSPFVFNFLFKVLKKFFVTLIVSLNYDHILEEKDRIDRFAYPRYIETSTGYVDPPSLAFDFAMTCSNCCLLINLNYWSDLIGPMVDGLGGLCLMA